MGLRPGDHTDPSGTIEPSLPWPLFSATSDLCHLNCSHIQPASRAQWRKQVPRKVARSSTGTGTSTWCWCSGGPTALRACPPVRTWRSSWSSTRYPRTKWSSSTLSKWVASSTLFQHFFSCPPAVMQALSSTCAATSSATTSTWETWSSRRSSCRPSARRRRLPVSTRLSSPSSLCRKYEKQNGTI